MGQQAEQLEQAVRIGRLGVEAGVEPDELARQGGRHDPTLLEHHPDARAQRGAVAARLQSEDANLARVRLPVAFEDLHGRRLARAVWPQERDERAGLHLEVEAVEHRQLAVALAQAPG